MAVRSDSVGGAESACVITNMTLRILILEIIKHDTPKSSENAHAVAIGRDIRHQVIPIG